MTDKLSDIWRSSEAIMKAVQVLLPADTEQITRALRRSMDAKELQMYDLALFCETEMLKAHWPARSFVPARLLV
jgi:hypothetical protein